MVSQWNSASRGRMASASTCRRKTFLPSPYEIFTLWNIEIFTLWNKKKFHLMKYSPYEILKYSPYEIWKYFTLWNIHLMKYWNIHLMKYENISPYEIFTLWNTAPIFPGIDNCLMATNANIYCEWKCHQKYVFFFCFFFKHNFCVKPYVPREPRRNPSNRRLNEHGIYIRQTDTARNRTHDLFRPKREPIPLGHSDGHVVYSAQSVDGQRPGTYFQYVQSLLRSFWRNIKDYPCTTFCAL